MSVRNGVVIARSESDEAIHFFLCSAKWIASLALAMTELAVAGKTRGRGVLDAPLSPGMTPAPGDGASKSTRFSRLGHQCGEAAGGGFCGQIAAAGLKRG